MRERTMQAMLLVALLTAAAPAQARRTAPAAPTPPAATWRVTVHTDTTLNGIEREVRVESLPRLAAGTAAAALRAVTVECDRVAQLAAAAEVAPTPPTPTPAVTPRVAPVARPARTVRVLRMGRSPMPTPMAEVVTDTLLGGNRPGGSLSLESLFGDINVTGWARNVIRVRAEHDPRLRVTAEWRGRELVLDADSPVGPLPVDWNIWVPATMPVNLSAIEGDIRVEGTRAPIEAQSVKGDVRVSGGSGVLDVSSVEGEVQVAGARGAVRAGSVNNAIRLQRLMGEVDAQTVNGDIQLSDLDVASIDASTVNGSVWYGGPFRDRARYRFSSHNGTLVVGVPHDAGIDLSVQSFNGGFQPALPVRIPRLQKGKRFEFQLGGGGASLDLESFNGLIRLVQLDELARLRALAPPPAPREKEGER